MNRDSWKYILVGISLAVVFICAISGLALIYQKIVESGLPNPSPVVTKIAVSTQTPNLITSGSIEPTTSTNKIDGNGISIGSYVEISGTGGVGLKMRLDPGKDSTPQFIAMENEVFEVKDGPRLSDDITWWLLVAPYDINRKGWAAGQYLTIINYP